MAMDWKALLAHPSPHRVFHASSPESSGLQTFVPFYLCGSTVVICHCTRHAVYTVLDKWRLTCTAFARLAGRVLPQCPCPMPQNTLKIPWHSERNACQGLEQFSVPCPFKHALSAWTVMAHSVNLAKCFQPFFLPPNLFPEASHDPRTKAITCAVEAVKLAAIS